MLLFDERGPNGLAVAHPPIGRAARCRVTARCSSAQEPPRSVPRARIHGAANAGTRANSADGIGCAQYPRPATTAPHVGGPSGRGRQRRPRCPTPPRPRPDCATRPAAPTAGWTSAPGWKCGGKSRAAPRTPPANCSKPPTGSSRGCRTSRSRAPDRRGSYAVIEGTLEVFMKVKRALVRAGETATVPAGVPHSVGNASDERAQIVNIHQPAQRHESFFRDMHRRSTKPRSSGCRRRTPAPPSTQRCCSASTRTRSARPNHPTRSSRRWR